MTDRPTEALIEISERFAPHLDATIVRFESQNPNMTARVEGAACRLSGTGADLPDTRSRFLQTLYREKIYADGLPMRRALIETLGS